MNEEIKQFIINEQCVFESLTKCPPSQDAEYHCAREPKIDEFFHVDYKDYEEQLLGKSYGYYLKEDKKKLVAAFSIANSALFLDTLQSARKNKINKEIPRVKHRRQYPALLICQLVVFDEFAPLHIGDQVMNDIKNLAIFLNETTASRFLLVEAVNKEKVLNFYEANGFDYLYSSEEIEKSMTRRPIDEKTGKLFTRLMKYDMMLIKK